MAHPDHLELFLQGPEAWNEKAKKAEAYGWDLTGERLGRRLIERYGESKVPSGLTPFQWTIDVGTSTEVHGSRWK